MSRQLYNKFKHPSRYCNQTTRSDTSAHIGLVVPTAETSCMEDDNLNWPHNGTLTLSSDSHLCTACLLSQVRWLKTMSCSVIESVAGYTRSSSSRITRHPPCMPVRPFSCCNATRRLHRSGSVSAKQCQLEHGPLQNLEQHAATWSHYETRVNNVDELFLNSDWLKSGAHCRKSLSGWVDC